MVKRVAYIRMLVFRTYSFPWQAEYLVPVEESLKIQKLFLSYMYAVALSELINWM